MPATRIFFTYDQAPDVDFSSQKSEKASWGVLRTMLIFLPRERKLFLANA
jgi:hypothetical protein